MSIVKMKHIVIMSMNVPQNKVIQVHRDIKNARLVWLYLLNLCIKTRFGIATEYQ